MINYVIIMARETKVIPDLYFPDEDEELQTCNVEGKEGHEQGGEVEKKKPVDLTLEGFIPIQKLTLEDLLEPIRTEKHLDLILALSKNVVKINNVSLSDRRPDDYKMEGNKSVSGSGFLLKLHGDIVLITTNRHVLFNEEELNKSTFDVYSQCHGISGDQKPLKRSGRKQGKYFLAKYSENDIAIAVYQVTNAMIAYIKEHCLDVTEIQSHLDLAPALTGDPNSPPVACLISHPLGQPKHVSFGEMVDYNMQTSIVHHTAPSKAGSSGGLVVVFSRSLISSRIFHVGTRLRSKKKYAIRQSFETSPSDIHKCFQELPNETEQMPTEEAIGPEEVVSSETPSKEGESRIAHVIEKAAPKLPSEANASIDVALLSAFIPVFGAFHLYVRNASMTGLGIHTLKPCKAFQFGDFLTSDTLKQSFKAAVQKLAQVAPSFTMCSSSELDEASDLVSLLESQGPCYCQSIVKMMERGFKLEDGTVTECFLSPYTAAAKMSSDGDVTWPWLNGSNPDIKHDNDTLNCLTQKCLELCDKGFIPFMLFLMIAKANIAVKELSSCPSDSLSGSASESVDQECQWETIYTRTTRIHPSKQSNEEKPVEASDSPPQAKEEDLHSSTAEEEENQHSLREEGLSILDAFFGSALPSMASRLMNTHLTAASLEKERVELRRLYSRSLSWLHQAQPYVRQGHSNTEHGGQETREEMWCRCERPKGNDTQASHTDLGFKQPQMSSNSQPFDPNIFGFGDIAQQLLNSGAAGMDCTELLQTLQHFAPGQGVSHNSQSYSTYSASTSAPDGNEIRGKTPDARTTEINPSEQSKQNVSSGKQESPLEKKKQKSSASEEKDDWRRVGADILSFIFPVLRLMTLTPSLKLSNTRGANFPHQEEREDVAHITLYSTCLAMSEHSSQHDQQVHPDRNRVEEKNNNGRWCHCGRPGMQDVISAYTSLVRSTLGELAESSQSFDRKLREDENIMLELQDKSSVGMGMAFMVFVTATQMVASQESLDPGTALLNVLDEMDEFPLGCRSLIHFMAFGEAFLRNLYLLARQISRHLQPWYFAFPVSVYGRPGNWPGNVTPPEVQDTAWRLIQDAIMASGFPPALQAALDKDAERREKLIDLYVDMKQLKWQGRIQPHLFGVYQATSQKDMVNHMQKALPFENPTHYFVWYTAYLVCPRIQASGTSSSQQCSLL